MRNAMHSGVVEDDNDDDGGDRSRRKWWWWWWVYVSKVCDQINKARQWDMYDKPVMVTENELYMNYLGLVTTSAHGWIHVYIIMGNGRIYIQH